MSSSPPADRTSMLEAIYREHHGLVRWVLRSRGITDASLDDLVHEAFLAIFRRLPERRPEVSMQTWVAGVARNVSFSHRRAAARQRHRLQGVAMPREAPLPDDVLERREAWHALAEFLDDLRPEQREVFVMVEVTGMQVSELAASTGVPANTLHSRLKVARTRFLERFAGPRDRPVELMQRAIEHGSATEQQRQRTWGLIVASTQWKAALPSASTLAASSARSGWLGSPMLTVATVLGGALGVAAVVSLRSPAGETTPARAASEARLRAPHVVIGPAQAPSSGVVPSAEAEATTAEPNTVDPGAPAEVVRRPSASQRTRLPIQVSPPHPAPSVVDPDAAIDPDAALVGAIATLQRARDDIARGRARAAITALDELGARFGTLERERRRLEQDAACLLGDLPRALEAARALAQLGVSVDLERPCGQPID